MTTTVLLGIVGALLSLLMEYVPGFDKWYAPKPSGAKRLIMIGLLAIATGLVFILACSGVLGALNWQVACTEQGAWLLVQLAFAAATGNQITHMLIKKE